jgi:CheY-like chemotaxis protein
LLRQTVLVLDDELVLAAMGRVLTLLGYPVLQARSAAEALTALGAHPEIGLLITDMWPPGTSGEAVAARARELRPDLRVLFVSSKDRPSQGSFLRKPFTVGMLAAKLDLCGLAGSW